MTSKIDSYCLRTNKYPFLCLRTRKTLSLGEFDESKTHRFLRSFFKNISGLNVQLMQNYGAITQICYFA